MYRIRLKTNWAGNIDGETVKVQAGDTVDVPIYVAKALCFERQIAELVPVEEIVQAEKPKPKPKRAKAVDKAPRDKMIAKAQNK